MRRYAFKGRGKKCQIEVAARQNNPSSRSSIHFEISLTGSFGYARTHHSGGNDRNPSSIGSLDEYRIRLGTGGRQPNNSRAQRGSSGKYRSNLPNLHLLLPLVSTSFQKAPRNSRYLAWTTCSYCNTALSPPPHTLIRLASTAVLQGQIAGL